MSGAYRGEDMVGMSKEEMHKQDHEMMQSYRADNDKLRATLDTVCQELSHRMLSEGICQCEDNGEESCWLCQLRDLVADTLSQPYKEY